MDKAAAPHCLFDSFLMDPGSNLIAVLSSVPKYTHTKTVILSIHLLSKKSVTTWTFYTN